jgi:hypothetical protein
MVGLLTPGERKTITLAVPMTENQLPVVITPKVGQVVIREASLTQVIVENKTTDETVPYLLVVSPRAVIKAATFDWKSLLKGLLPR